MCGTAFHHIAVVELSDNRNPEKLVFPRALQPHPQALELPVGTELSLYAAECCGELILIVIVEYNPMVYHVFKWKSGERNWLFCQRQEWVSLECHYDFGLRWFALVKRCSPAKIP
jgi:hypothetical protein